MSASGEARPLSSDRGTPERAWAPNDDRLAYVSSNGDLVVFDGRVGAGTTLVVGSGQLGRPRWSPDGRTIAYSRSESQPDHLPLQQLWTVDVATGTKAMFVGAEQPKEGYIMPMGWTGDGRDVLYIQGAALSASLLADGAPLYAVPAAGGDPVEIASGTLVYDDFLATLPGYATVAAVVGGGRTAWSRKTLAIGGLLQPLSALQPAVEGAESSPSWSPDGTAIAFVAGPETAEDVYGGQEARQALLRRRIYVQELRQGGKPRLLLDQSGFRDERPLWAKDGAEILFGRFDTTDEASLWLVAATGGTPRLVVGHLGPFDPRYGATWFGYYGHVDWGAVSDWWQPR